MFFVSWVLPGNMRSLSLEGDGGISEDEKVPEGVKYLFNYSGLPHHTTAFNGPRKYILQERQNIFFAYSWLNNTNMTLTMLASCDNGKNWTAPMDIWKDTTSDNYENLPHMGLYKWKEQIILIFLTGQLDRNVRQLLIMKAPINNWRTLASATPMAIRSFEGSNWDVSFDDKYMYIAEIRSGEWQGQFYKYDNVNWTMGKNINAPGTTMRVAIENVDTPNGTRLLYFYCRPYTLGYSTGNVHLVTSTDGGSNWGQAVTVMDNSNDYSMIVCEKIGNKLILFASRLTGDEIDIISSTDGGVTWTSERTIIRNRGLNKLDWEPNKPDSTADTDFSIGYRNDVKMMLLAYEGGDNKIRLIHSEDNGTTWSPESEAMVLLGNDSYGVCLSEDGNFFSCVVDLGKDLDNIYLYDMSDLVIGNNTTYPPMIINNDITEIDVNSSYNFTYYASDRDTSSANLHWAMQTNASWLSLDANHRLYGTPTDVGQYWVNITVSDGTGLDFTNFTVQVKDVNEHNMEYEPLELTLEEDGDALLLEIKTVFPEQSSYEIIEIKGGSQLQVDITEDGNILVRPEQNWAGTNTLTIIFEKDGKLVERRIEVDVPNINDPPYIAAMNTPHDKILAGESFQLQAVWDDLDLIYGDTHYFTWYVDGIEYEGDGRSINLELPEGTYIVTVTITDSEGENGSYSVEIEVVRDDDEESDFSFLIIFSMVSLLLISMVLMIFIFVISRRRIRSSVVADIDSMEPGSQPIVGHQQVLGGHIGPEIEPRMAPSISQIHDDVLDGREIDYEDGMMIEDLRRMRDQRRISDETYELIRDRIEQMN